MLTKLLDGNLCQWIDGSVSFHAIILCFIREIHIYQQTKINMTLNCTFPRIFIWSSLAFMVLVCFSECFPFVRPIWLHLPSTMYHLNFFAQLSKYHQALSITFLLAFLQILVCLITPSLSNLDCQICDVVAYKGYPILCLVFLFILLFLLNLLSAWLFIIGTTAINWLQTVQCVG